MNDGDINIAMLGNIQYTGKLHIEAKVLSVNGTIKSDTKEGGEIFLVGKQSLFIQKNSKLESTKIFLYGKNVVVDNDVAIKSKVVSSCTTEAHINDQMFKCFEGEDESLKEEKVLEYFNKQFGT